MGVLFKFIACCVIEFETVFHCLIFLQTIAPNKNKVFYCTLIDSFVKTVLNQFGVKFKSISGIVREMK